MMMLGRRSLTKAWWRVWLRRTQLLAPHWLQLLLLYRRMLLLQWVLPETPLLLHLPQPPPLPRPVFLLLPVVQLPPRLLLAALIGEIDPLALCLFLRQRRVAMGVRLRDRCTGLGVMARHLVGMGLGMHLEVRAVGRRLRRGAL